jgi:transcriptional regulator of acetoin/glycerol metabolism
VRELENVLERARLLAADGPIDLHHLPEEVRSAEPASLRSLEEVERTHIKRILQTTKDFDEAATVLGIDRKTLFNKRKKYDL